MSTKISNLQTKLSSQQKHTLEYWRVATNEIENTCLSVLHILYQNNDYTNYLKYQQQFCNFKDIRNALFDVVLSTIETDNLFLMENIVIDAVKQLMNMIVLYPQNHRYSTGKSVKLKRSIGRVYNQIALIIVECMSKLKIKVKEIDDYLSNIPTKQLKYETEALKTVTMLNNFAKRLSFLLEITLKGREEKNEQIARSVSHSIEIIMSYIKGISLASATCDQRLLKMQRPLRTLTSSTCLSVEANDALVRRKRNIWSLVKAKKHQPLRLNDVPDTSRFVESILNDDSLRFRDKLKGIKERIKCSTKKLHSHEGTIPYGWIHPTEEQIEEYICKNGGCPTSTFQTIQVGTLNARQRFTLEELVKNFPVETQHLRFPPNPSNASIFKREVEKALQCDTFDEDLLEGLLWQWHEDSDSESTISIRFQFEMSDTHRREKWFRGYRRLLNLDSTTTDLLKKEIELVKQSKSYVGVCIQPDSNK